jgi:Flp pilus assembly protein TadD
MSLARTFLTLAALATSLAGSPPARAADDPSPQLLAPRTDRLVAARKLVAAKQWAQARAELNRNADATDADWNNLMGFVLRSISPPDLARAEQHYDTALRIEPLHRGALEYSGELYLMRGDLARAEKRLAELENACPQGCKEYGDLERAIERHKKEKSAAAR